jgi:hypothetical protein
MSPCKRYVLQLRVRDLCYESVQEICVMSPCKRYVL